MHEFVGVVQAEDETCADSIPKCRVHRLFCFPANQGESGDLGDVAQAGELFQGFLSGGGESLQLVGHQIHHVVGEVLGTDAIDIPLPSCRDWVEREQPLFGQGGEELDRKERISAGLLVHQLRQGLARAPARNAEHRRRGGRHRRAREAPARFPAPCAPALRIASSVRISGCARPTSLSL